MARPGQINHIVQGLLALPEKYRFETQLKFLSVYLQQYNDQEEVQQQLLEALLNWSHDAPTFRFIYDLIGKYLDQPRPDGFDDIRYKFYLLGRTKVRRSAATYDGVLNVVNYLARGNGFILVPLVPKAWVVAFFDLGLDVQEQELYRRLLTDTIGQQDKLSLDFITSGTAIYDDAVFTYDSGLYA